MNVLHQKYNQKLLSNFGILDPLYRELNSSEEQKMTENKPVHKLRAGQITATIWKNTKRIDDREVDFFTTTIEKSYKDKDDWKTTNSMQVNDLPKVVLVSNLAYQFIVLAKQED